MVLSCQSCGLIGRQPHGAAAAGLQLCNTEVLELLWGRPPPAKQQPQRRQEPQDADREDAQRRHASRRPSRRPLRSAAADAIFNSTSPQGTSSRYGIDEHTATGLQFFASGRCSPHPLASKVAHPPPPPARPTGAHRRDRVPRVLCSCEPRDRLKGTTSPIRGLVPSAAKAAACAASNARSGAHGVAQPEWLTDLLA